MQQLGYPHVSWRAVTCSEPINIPARLVYNASFNTGCASYSTLVAPPILMIRPVLLLPTLLLPTPLLLVLQQLLLSIYLRQQQPPLLRQPPPLRPQSASASTKPLQVWKTPLGASTTP